MEKYVQFFEIFFEKWIIRVRKMLKFLKMYSFSNTLILFKIINFVSSRGGNPPPDPLRGPVIAFNWPGRPLENSGDASEDGCFNRFSNLPQRYRNKD